MEQKYNAPIDKVYALLTDPKWLEARSLAVGFETMKTRLRYAMSKLRTCMGAYLAPEQT